LGDKEGTGKIHQIANRFQRREMLQLHNPSIRVLASLFVSLIMVSMACNLTSSNQNAIGTSSAQTVTAEYIKQTETAKAAPTNTLPPPTVAPIEIAPTTAVLPPPVQPTTEIVPPALTAPTAVGLDNVNCREGPDPIFPEIGALLKGEKSDIIGTNENKTWWLINDPRHQDQSCWVWSGVVQVSGDTSTVPYIPPPPTPEIPDIFETEDPLFPFPSN
jgi:hypothetical protein